MAPALVALSILACHTAHGSTSGAEELVRQGVRHEAAHDDEVAVRRYSDALSLDPTFGEAYMRLAALRVRRGDLREAERVYSVALARLPEMMEALRERARTRWAIGDHDDAEADMRGYGFAAGDLAALEELAGWYGDDGRVPSQLSTWRAILAAARRTDPKIEAEARIMVRALQIMLGPADPVTSPQQDDPTRRSLAAIARRTP